MLFRGKPESSVAFEVRKARVCRALGLRRRLGRLVCFRTPGRNGLTLWERHRECSNLWVSLKVSGNVQFVAMHKKFTTCRASFRRHKAVARGAAAMVIGLLLRWVGRSLDSLRGLCSWASSWTRDSSWRRHLYQYISTRADLYVPLTTYQSLTHIFSIAPMPYSRILRYVICGAFARIRKTNMFLQLSHAHSPHSNVARRRVLDDQIKSFGRAAKRKSSW